MVDTQELSIRTFRDYHAGCAEIVEHFGKERLVEDCAPEDFEAFVRFFDFRHMHGAFVWLAHDGFVAAGKTKSRKILIFSGYTCNLIVAIL